MDYVTFHDPQYDFSRVATKYTSPNYCTNSKFIDFFTTELNFSLNSKTFLEISGQDFPRIFLGPGQPCLLLFGACRWGDYRLWDRLLCAYFESLEHLKVFES